MTKLSNYIIENSIAEDKILKELNRETHLKVLRPRMISGHEQGILLYMLVRMLRPKNILEIGTYTGYSAISMARGLDADGQLVTIEKNDEIRELTQRFVDRAKLTDKVTLLTGNAKEIIPELDRTFELVFIDADKREYIDYYELAFDKVANNGFFLADNVLWSGKILEENPDNDAQTQGIIAFNEHIRNDKRVENIILPLRDGMSVIRKK